MIFHTDRERPSRTSFSYHCMMVLLNMATGASAECYNKPLMSMFMMRMSRKSINSHSQSIKSIKTIQQQKFTLVSTLLIRTSTLQEKLPVQQLLKDILGCFFPWEMWRIVFCAHGGRGQSLVINELSVTEHTRTRGLIRRSQGTQTLTHTSVTRDRQNNVTVTQMTWPL